MTIVDVDRFELVLAERMAPPSKESFVRPTDVRGDRAKVDEAAIMDMREQAAKVAEATGVKVDKWESVVVALSQEARSAV
jgi:hypothetical protein